MNSEGNATGALADAGDDRLQTAVVAAAALSGGGSLIVGSAAPDLLLGGVGDDTLDGGDGADTLDGAEGSDVYLVRAIAETPVTFDRYGDSGATGVDRIIAEGSADMDVGFDRIDAGIGIEVIDASNVNGLVRLVSDDSDSMIDFRAIAIISAARQDGAFAFGNVLIDAGAGNDTVRGSLGDDAIAGGQGNDVLDGGAGSDVYRVSGSVAYGFEGYDTIADTGALGVDRLVAVGSGAVDIGLSTLGPSSGLEIIDATRAGGPVRLLGTFANSVFDLSGITVLGEVLVDAGAGNDTVIGSTGNDLIAASQGDDLLNGGAGSDVYVVEGNVTNAIDRFSGFDTYADSGRLGEIDTIRAIGAGVDIGVAAFGPSNGIDLLDVSRASGEVRLFAGGGDQQLDFSSLSYAGLRDGVRVVLDGGAGADTIRGTGSADFIAGGSGDDRLNGGEGADTYLYSGVLRPFMPGFQGYDTITDSGTGGIDRIRAEGPGNVDIGLKTFSAASGIETIDASGAAGVVRLLGDDLATMFDLRSVTTVIGNLVIDTQGGNDQVFGTARRDVMVTGEGDDRGWGGGGNDDISGGGGNDWLYGEAGDDLLAGGLGTDELNGGLGADTFRFASISEAGLGASRDRIADFRTGVDRIDLAAIDASTATVGDQAFAFLGAGAFSGAAAELRFANGMLSGDVNGDRLADFEIALLNGAQVQGIDLFL